MKWVRLNRYTWVCTHNEYKIRIKRIHKKEQYRKEKIYAWWLYELRTGTSTIIGIQTSVSRAKEDATIALLERKIAT